MNAAASAEPALAGLSRRFAARVIDTLVLTGAGWAMFPLQVVTGSIAAATAIGVVIGFVVQSALITARGQSIGKIAMGIEIVDRAGETVGFVRGVLLRELPFAILRALPGPLRVLGLVDVLFAFREGRRCLHDHLAGTQVVERPAD